MPNERTRSNLGHVRTLAEVRRFRYCISLNLSIAVSSHSNINSLKCIISIDLHSSSYFGPVNLIIIASMTIYGLLCWFLGGITVWLHFVAPFTTANVTGYYDSHIMTSPNGNIFPITGLLCGEFDGHQWIPLTKARDAELWCFLCSAPE